MKKIFEWILNNILTLIQFLMPIGAVIYASVNATIRAEFLLIDWILSAIIILQAGVVLFLYLRFRLSYKSYFYPSSKIKSSFEVLEKVVSYKRDENDTLTFKRKLTIKSKVDNLRSITDKFIWTGESKAQIPHGSLNIEDIRGMPQRKGIWRFYDITLNQCLRKGEKLTIEYFWEPILNCSTSSPFVSTPTEEATRNLKLEISLGPKYKNKPMILEEYRSIDGSTPLETHPVSFDQSGNYIWEVKKPKRFRYFIARWTWES